MPTVGLHGGHSIYELGTASDVHLFFELIDKCVAQARTERDWSILTDRLYRRYLRQEELGVATELMNEVRDVFATLPSSSVKWSERGGVETRLNHALPTLADIFEKYFDNFSRACRSALSFMDCFKTYQPVKMVISDQPWFLLESQRTLDEYDALEGNPFWLR